MAGDGGSSGGNFAPMRDGGSPAMGGGSTGGD